MHYDELQRKINYAFKDLSLLDAAMTHSSYANEQNTKCGARRVAHNETLEFLGDAVLGFTIAEHLYGASPQENEGGLSRKRAAIVCERSLADCARALGIGCLIKLGKSTGKAKDRDKPSILSDAMEALFAAVYLDGGMEMARRVILSALGSAIMASMTVSRITDYKTCLQERLHNGKITDIEYAVVRETGPDHDKTFTSSVAANGRVLGTGSGSTKKESEQNAARVALAGLAAPDAGRAAPDAAPASTASGRVAQEPPTQATPVAPVALAAPAAEQALPEARAKGAACDCT
jgi:ribonuclease-3